MEDKNNEQTFTFGFNTGTKKAADKMESKLEKRRKTFLKEHDAEDLKRKRDEKTTTLRKDIKKNKFQKRRAINMPGLSGVEEKKEDDKRTFTIEEAESMYNAEMDLMDYFKILTKTQFQLPHFLLLIELM